MIAPTIDQRLFERAIDRMREGDSLVVFFTGAPGSGKSTAVRELSPNAGNEDIGICAYDLWQWDNLGTSIACGLEPTRRWIASQVVPAASAKKVILCDAMHQPEIVRQAALLEGVWNYMIIHLTCSPETRLYRLEHARQQPELVTKKLCEWAAKLDNDARGSGTAIINTGVPLPSVASDLRRLIVQRIVRGPE